jgi:TldD protein
MLIGHGKDVLFKIDKIADNLNSVKACADHYRVRIPVDVGQPTIRVSSMTVGGSGGRK